MSFPLLTKEDDDMKTSAISIETELLSMKNTQALCGRSRQWIYSQLRNDPTFPRRVKTCPHSFSFRKSVLLAWGGGRPGAGRGGGGAGARRRRAGRGGRGT